MSDTATEGPAELGRRERKKLETRRALASAALHLAAERGPDQITIEDIADAVDVSVRTFFNYFSSKEEAIIGWDPEARVPIADRLVNRPADEPPFEAMRNVIHDTLAGADAAEWANERALRSQLVRKHPSLLPRHLAAHHELERSLLRAMETRMGVEPGGSLYAALVVMTCVNAMRLVLARWEEGGRSVPIHTLLDEAFDALARGLTPEGGK